MTRIVLFFLSIFLISQFSFAQNYKLSSSLSQELKKVEDTPGAMIQVGVILEEQLITSQVKAEFDIQGLTSKERTKATLIRLQNLAKSSQANLMTFLQTKPGSYGDLQQFWLVNMFTLEASPELIYELSRMESVARIELESSYSMRAVKPTIVEENSFKSVNGVEPGLVAVNAPALWAMGYTGRGLISYTLDTGVWPEHPSLGGRFIGNNYAMSRAWLGFNSHVPVDKGNSHGTHVTGTTLGLDKATNDTIGVAFNAYFMAADPVATTLATVKPISAFVEAFEWSMNPDGDINTTHDIPEVINNSWGYDIPTDTLLCHSFVSQALETMALSGIACVFSAGNDGPGDSTIGSPHHINTGLVNSFTVGSISPHDTAYPISSFSSRGPSICPASGALAIKPEVVAPGYQIRSSVDQDSYATYNGTSMASPHVTGVVLLLREAFPNITGEEVLLALYHSAHDLGVAGEDNTYGNGMIDALAAFNYLALTHTPAPPRNMTYDLAIKSVTNPDFTFTCDTSIIPKIEIFNNGDSALPGGLITYWFDYSNIQAEPWVGPLAPGQSTIITLPSINTIGDGNKELQFHSVINNSIIEGDNINNSIVTRFNVRGKTTLPYFEDFEEETLNDNGYYAENPDNSNTWSIDSTGGLWGNSSAKISCSNYIPRTFQKDDLLSPYFDLPNSGKVTLIFNRAYQLKLSTLADSLNIYIVNACDFSQRTLVYSKGGLGLETLDSTYTTNFPRIESHWVEDTIDLTPFLGMQNVMLDFQSVNKGGADIFVDNIRLFEGDNAPNSLTEIMDNAISIYPNPTNNSVFIKSEIVVEDNIQLSVFDMYGRVLKTQTLDRLDSQVEISLSEYTSGMYFIMYQSKSFTKSFKIIKE